MKRIGILLMVALLLGTFAWAEGQETVDEGAVGVWRCTKRPNSVDEWINTIELHPDGSASWFSKLSFYAGNSIFAVPPGAESDAVIAWKSSETGVTISSNGEDVLELTYQDGSLVGENGAVFVQVVGIESWNGSGFDVDEIMSSWMHGDLSSISGAR